MASQKYIKSASIILQRSSGEVFLTRRASTVSFFPNFWVFPGGKIDEDLPDTWTGTEFEVYETIFRELYEEVGIVAGSEWTIPPEERNTPFLVQNYDDEKRREFKQSMVYVGKKNTPPFRKKVYSAAYFHLKGELVDELDPKVDGSELVEGEWIQPEVAVEQWESGERMIPPPILQLLRNINKDHFVTITLNETFLPMGLQTKIEFAPNFQCIPIDSNTIDPFFNTNLVVIGDTDCIIVDPGANEEGKGHLRDILLSLPSVSHVVLTHHHRDHWEGIDVVQELYPGIDVLAHPQTLARISTELPTTEIQGGELLIAGESTVKVVHSPGHTDGHISLYDDKTGVIVAGDHVVGYGSAVLDPQNGSMIDYFETTRKLKELDANLIIPAHGPPNFAPSVLLQQYLDHRTMREESILSSIQEGNHSLDDIVRDVYDDVPEKMWEYAKRNIQLHIEKLDLEDRLPDGIDLESID